MSTVYCRSCGKEVHDSAETCPACGAPQLQVGDKNKVVAALLAFFTGAFGFHRFYLGQWWGVFYLLLFWTGIPSIVAFIETFVFLFSDQRQWDIKYNNGLPSGSGKGIAAVLIALIVLVGAFFILGILAAIAIPAYADYTARAQVAEGLSMASAQKAPLAEYYSDNKDFSNISIADLQGQTSGNYVDSITLAQAHGETVVIVTKFKQSGVQSMIAGQNFKLATEDGGRTWQCGYAIQDPALMGSDQVKPKYLPTACR